LIYFTGGTVSNLKLKNRIFTGMFFIVATLFSYCNNVWAQALENVKQDCRISDHFSKISNMTSINTAVTATGALAGGGALYAGIKKSQTDALLKKIETGLEQVQNMTEQEFLELLAQMAIYANTGTDYDKEIEELIASSKSLGNWRTGLMAGNTATNIAGTIISSKNTNADDIKIQVNKCLASVGALSREYMQARMDDSQDPIKLAHIKQVIDQCGRYNLIDMDKVIAMSKGVMISSAIGVGTGTAGTITSAIANTDKIRDNNQADGQKKEAKLNTASNVLAGASMAISGVATGFNIATLSAINTAKDIIQGCEEILQ
jgi:hypothetical protein